MNVIWINSQMRQQSRELGECIQLLSVYYLAIEKKLYQDVELLTSSVP